MRSDGIATENTEQFMRLARRIADESGVALITALLAVMLMSALMVGMFAALATDQRSHALDRDQTQAYAAAQAGLEKLTSGLATLFVTDVSPSVAQINTVAATPPVIPGFSFTAPGGAAGSGYAITYPTDVSGNPQALPLDITTGPFSGFKGLITKYTATITAVSTGGAEVRLRREIQTVAVPVFQFGVFSDSNLTFYAGDTFAFGGRVHTNASLFLCEFGPSLTFTDRITAVNAVVHNYLSNGLLATTYGCASTVNIPTSSSTWRNLQQTPNEGSITGMPPDPWTAAAAAAVANPNWPTISTGAAYYKSYIRTSLTGAKALNLPLVSQGATPVDLIRRPVINTNENVTNAPVFGQRYFSQASLRILLSDRVADLTGLPTITGAAPVWLNGVDGVGGDWVAAPPAGYVVDATHPPIARSIGPGVMQTTNAAPWSTYAGGLSQIYIDNAIGIPAVWKLPAAITVGVIPGVVCTGKLFDRFTGCTPAPLGGYPNNAVVSAVLPSGATAQTNTNGITLVGSTQIVVTNNGTAQFSPNLLWINNANALVAGTAMPITCEGYTDVNPRRFINCRGLSVALPNNPVTPITTSALANQNTGTIGGYIKIEKQDINGVWTDVTMEILNLGIGARNSGGVVCAEPTPDAVLRIQRLHDNGGGPNACVYNNSLNSWDWWPNTLYDTREGNFRDIATTSPMMMGGVMQYISLDTGNLARWFSGAIGATGNLALNNNGYIVYFSDRRGNHDQTNGNIETAEFGFEDKVNPTTVGGLPDATLQTGEDVNFMPPPALPNGQQLYGGSAWNNTPLNIPTGALAPYVGGVVNTPAIVIPIGNAIGPPIVPGAGIARVNKVVLFRRALKLVNGGIVGGVNSLPVSGLTVASENPVYVQGNYNATTDPLAEPNVPAAVIADAVTLLSNNWSDAASFEVPNLFSAAARNATTTGYRMAVVAGKGLSFPYCAAACGNPAFLFGTDGGIGNFLRLLEDWRPSVIGYRGSLVTLHNSRQATGTFKYNTNVYDFGVRNFTFDTDFLTPALLPPGTPMFRDINTLKFRQILRPNQ
jgi:hypothetical protein